MKLCQLNDATVEALNNSAIAEVAAELGDDHGAPDHDATVAKLAKMKPLDFDKVFKDEADRLGVRASTLDREVKKARKSAAVDSGNFLRSIRSVAGPSRRRCSA